MRGQRGVHFAGPGSEQPHHFEIGADQFASEIARRRLGRRSRRTARQRALIEDAQVVQRVLPRLRSRRARNRAAARSSPAGPRGLRYSMLPASGATHGKPVFREERADFLLGMRTFLHFAKQLQREPVAVEQRACCPGRRATRSAPAKDGPGPRAPETPACATQATRPARRHNGAGAGSRRASRRRNRDCAGRCRERPVARPAAAGERE